MSIRNKIGLAMTLLLCLALIIGNFLNGFWNGIASVGVTAWVVIALELSSSRK